MGPYTTSYQLGARSRFSDAITAGICWKNKGGFEGVLAWARDERTGEYVRVYEVGPEEWVQGEPQSWTSGNFATIDSAKKWASTAYRYLNKGKKGVR